MTDIKNKLNSLITFNKDNISLIKNTLTLISFKENNNISSVHNKELKSNLSKINKIFKLNLKV